MRDRLAIGFAAGLFVGGALGWAYGAGSADKWETRTISKYCTVMVNTRTTEVKLVTDNESCRNEIGRR